MRETQKTKFARKLRKQMTRAEVLLWARLRREALGWKFRRQVPVGPYVADFACIEARLIVEVDGATHSTAAETAHDACRTAFLVAEGWRLERFHNREVVDNMEGVVETLVRAAWEHEQTISRSSEP